MLYLIGMGLEKGDMTLKGIEALKKMEAYVEDYTSFPYELDFPVKHISRKDVESDFLVSRARKGDIALLVPGDPLFATTHITLVSDCVKNGVPFKIIHAPSVINALPKTGLSSYNFGRIVTLSRVFESDKTRIESNQKAGLHTLCLLDPAIDAVEGLAVLKKMGFGKNMLVCERLGMADEKLYYGSLSELKQKKFGKSPHSIIIPGKLQFFEEEFLQQFSLKA